MNLKLVQTLTLIAAAVTTGVTAGTLAAFAYSVIPGLRHTDDRTYVTAMNEMNKSILNGWFLFCFMGGLLFIIAAGALHLHRTDRPVLYWLIAAVVLYGAVLLITSGVNVPLNNTMLHDADHHVASFTAIREHFDSKWATWNVIRVVVNIAAMVAIAGALVAHGHTSNNAHSTLQHAAQAPAAGEAEPSSIERREPGACAQSPFSTERIMVLGCP